jgi:hypothetical protein
MVADPAGAGSPPPALCVRLLPNTLFRRSVLF